MAILTENSYGKSGVKLTKVSRRGDVHEVKQLEVAIALRGEFTKCYTEGDNSMVVPTDTMKNTVYALAKKNEFDSIEFFAKILGKHFVDEFSHVASATIEIQETLWNRMVINGKSHEHSFVGGNDEKRTCKVVASRGAIHVQGGISGLAVLKTTRSGFVNYIKDQYTTLKETTDRIFATTVNATWNFPSADAGFNGCHKTIRDAIVNVFAAHDSLAVQQTLYAMGEAALAACKEIDEISFVMPNQHHLLINLQPFGMENSNEIFVPTTEPFGMIAGTIRRK
ncbi:MAG TPA: urate oxidase [Tepidisphaeraceae bacterium]|nr:urate oxidase [Tepidisphaeraceae bacterium]